MGIHRAEQSIEIAASPEACFEAILDYETFPSWQSAVKSAEVLSKDAEGRAERVAFRVDAKLREVGYTLSYSYEAPHRVSWDFVEGDGVEHVEGEYRFEAAGAATTATYVLGIDPGMPVPGFVVDRINRQVMWRSVGELRDEVEARVSRTRAG